MSDIYYATFSPRKRFIIDVWQGPEYIYICQLIQILGESGGMGKRLGKAIRHSTKWI